MKRKIISLLVAAMLLPMMAGLSGCGKKDNTLLWYVIGDEPKDKQMVLDKANEIIEPELGLKLDIQYIDSASFTEKMKLKMASGEAYDLTFTGYANPYRTAVNMGGLYDITDLIENIEMKDGTKVKMSDVIEDYYLQAAMVNGRIYGIPNIQVISNPRCIEMEKAVAEECGVDIEGLQEAALNNHDYESCKAYLDKITGELAKIKAKRPDMTTVNPFNPATGNIYEELVGGCVIRRDGSSNEVVIKAFTDEYKYYVDTIRSWYEAGYIRNDIASKGNSFESTEEKRNTAVTDNSWKPGQEVYFINERGVEPVYAWNEEPYVLSTQALLTMVSVGANAKHPEEAVKFIYMMNSNKELYNLICWGIEGKHYTKNADGTATPIADSGYNIASSAWKYGNQFNGFVMEGQPLDVWEQTKKMNDEARKSPALGFVPDTTNIETELANITNVMAEYKAKTDFGTAPRSEYWDELVGKLKDAGIEKVRDELQKQYDDFLKSKK